MDNLHELVQCANAHCGSLIERGRAELPIAHGLCVPCNRLELHKSANMPECGVMIAQRRANDDGFAVRLR